MMPLEQATLPWPELPLAPWRPTRDTLHMWTQIVGKTLLALAPAQNHWWHTALRVTSRGLASAPIMDGGRSFDIELDLVDHALSVRSDGRFATMALAPRTVKSFYEEYLALLRTVGVHVHLWTMPVEVPDPIPFDRDEVHREYDAAAAYRFGQVLRCCDASLKALANGYVGKQSPVHFFWGSFDLAATRFSGRRAPERPGADAITREAYSHEAISFGFWPGGAAAGGTYVDEPVLYAYAAPEPDGFREARVAPPAGYDARLGEFILPYAVVRAADDPALAVRAFCESVYEAGARLGKWDRDTLERAPLHAG
ncbi:MAG TPA: DUF5996 family protein [Anaeromyxobacteraceae bacterium]